MKKIAFKVKKIAEKSILQGHPWVFESSIIKQNKEGVAGDLAVIFDQRRNKFLAVGLYDPLSSIRIRVLQAGLSTNVDQAFFQDKFLAAFEKRASLLATKTTAYRLIYGENDGLSGLIIDIYNDHAVIKLYSAVWFSLLEWLTEILTEHYNVSTIVLRLSRILQNSETTYRDGQVIAGTLDKEEVIFLEHDLKFKVNLIKGHKTGYFLDHRNNRLKVRSLASGKRVLDIFSYAGGFSVNAIAGGASEVVSLDISAQALEIAKSNVSLNFTEYNHAVLAIDAFEGIKKLRKEKKEFDLIIVDPPSFAKSEDHIERALHSYRRLVAAVLPLISKKGILLMASCSSRVEKESFFDLVEQTITNSGRKYRVLEKATHDVDHPEGIKEMSYLKSIYLEIT